MSVVKRVRAALSGAESDGADPESDDDGTSDSSEERTTNLYVCEECGTTYVSTEKESCSECEAPVERVPTEQDLGLL